MHHLDFHPGPFGLTGRDIVISLAIALLALVLAPAIGVLLLLLVG